MSSDAIVGIDPSSRKIAAVVTYGEDTETPTVWTMKLTSDDITHRCRTAFSSMRKFLKLEVVPRAMGDTYVFIEDPVVGRGGAYATIVQAKVHGALIAACMSVEGVVLVRGVNNSKAKKAVVGKGNAAKGDIKAWAQTYWNALFVLANDGRDQDLLDSGMINRHGYNIVKMKARVDDHLRSENRRTARQVSRKHTPVKKRPAPKRRALP